MKMRSILAAGALVAAMSPAVATAQTLPADESTTAAIPAADYVWDGRLASDVTREYVWDPRLAVSPEPTYVWDGRLASDVTREYVWDPRLAVSPTLELALVK